MLNLDKYQNNTFITVIQTAVNGLNPWCLPTDRYIFVALVMNM